jgi:hypothetical protein
MFRKNTTACPVVGLLRAPLVGAYRLAGDNEVVDLMTSSRKGICRARSISRLSPWRRLQSLMAPCVATANVHPSGMNGRSAAYGCFSPNSRIMISRIWNF